MSRTFLVFAILATVVAVPFIAFNLIVGFLGSTTAAGMGLVFSFGYLALILLVLRLTPFWPRLPFGQTLWWMVASLMWGAGFCMTIVLLTAGPATYMAQAAGWEDALASFGGAYPEEPAKALGVLVILLAFRGLNRPWHGLATGAVVGLGFETIENFLYGAMLASLHPDSDFDGVIGAWVLRVFAGPGLHIIWTGLVGWGLGQALFAARRGLLWRFGVVFGWLSVAFVAHFLWNYLGSNSVALATMVLAGVIQYTAIAWVVWRAWRQAKRDRTYVYTKGAITSIKQWRETMPPARGRHRVEAESGL
ncbi:PrsW family intramembrane metalloprotease [Corynebacterium yudongzhengii]|uniref:Protease PrsW n=1 Tax=Corynebacterium yudongzhengii TaxID=2080740 RepID=A0A2U1T5K4_9CORY|nr:PrsW family intramembrane metalloprotease [Corynebacterium yudongzhengii]AWB81017.1 PrsW family intramembrane metalloprotease [Corynebacterium yudongzhengii]PWC01262.1 protease PrsW [Corynebacterium yudongzhengii]